MFAVVGEEAQMTLRQKQSKFVLMISDLVRFAYANGYELTYGDAWAKTGHRPGSNHYRRLAVDFNLFKDGVWLDKGPAMEKGHGMLHDYWDYIGGAARIEEDMNHYSLEHNGMR